ncbi:MAG: glycosyltransferase family 4 protein [Bdellovibrionales bacterium]
MSVPPKPHILFFVAEDWSFLSHRIGIARAAVKAGYRVSLMTRVCEGRQQIEEAGIELHHFALDRAGINPFQELLTFFRIVRMYHKIKPDFVHQVAMKPVVYGSLAARLLRIRGRVNALIGMGFVFSSPTLLAHIIRPCLKLMLHIALGGKKARLILQNEDDVAFFETQKILPSSSIRLIRGSGVDPSHYVMTPEGLDQTPIIILPARFLKDKGIAEFVEAARILKDRNVRARMVLVGKPDPMNPSSFSDAQIMAWIDEGVVENWGWSKDMRPILQQANIVCLPSYREGLPKALLEAASCGRAMVTTDVPGCRELVKAGQNGWVVPVRNARALAGALEEAIARPDMRATYIKKSRELIESIFSDTHIHEQTLAVYREIQ